VSLPKLKSISELKVLGDVGSSLDCKALTTDYKRANASYSEELCEYFWTCNFGCQVDTPWNVNKPVLSTGGKIGVGIGASIAGLIFILVLYKCIRKRQNKAKSNVATEMEMSSVTLADTAAPGPEPARGSDTDNRRSSKETIVVTVNGDSQSDRNHVARE